MYKLNVLIISDGKPGHYTQSLGLLNHLKKAFLVQENICLIRPRIKIANYFLRNSLNKSNQFSHWLFTIFYHVDDKILLTTKPDLIISTGGNTCGVNALLAKRTGAKNFFIGSLRGQHPSFFSAVISATPMEEVENNIVLDVSPSLIDLEQLSTAANNFLMSKKIAQDELYWVMLIGGEGSGYSYKKSDIRTLVDGMLLLAKKYQINWLLTTSRRLGKSNEDYLKGLLSGEKSISYAVYYIAKPEKVMNAFLGLGDIIFCTEDSTSMINEAVTTQKPVVTLRARTQGINRGHQDVITRFENNGHIERIKIDELHQFSPQSVQFNPINIEKGYDKVIRLIEQEVIGR